MALAQILGGESISDFHGLRNLALVIGPVPSTPTVWRAPSAALVGTARRPATTLVRRGPTPTG